MSDLSDAIAAGGAPLVDAQVQKWVGALVNTMSVELMPITPPRAQGLVAAAIKALADNAPMLGQTTAAGFGAIVHHLAVGETDEARLVWLGQSSFEDRMKARDDASDATRAFVEARSAQWASVKDVALTVVKAIAAAAVPLLLGL